MFEAPNSRSNHRKLLPHLCPQTYFNLVLNRWKERLHGPLKRKEAVVQMTRQILQVFFLIDTCSALNAVSIILWCHPFLLQDTPSGLRSSEIAPGTPLSYTDMSSATGSNIGEHPSSIRLGVNEASTLRSVTEMGSSADPGAQVCIFRVSISLASYSNFPFSFLYRQSFGVRMSISPE